MQVIERVLLSNNWVALLFIFGLCLMSVLKLFYSEKMKGYSLSVFNKGFVEIESEEKSSPFSFFNITFTFFSFLTISFAIYSFLENYTESPSFDFFKYLQLSLYVLIYMVGRFVVEFFVMTLLEIKSILFHFFLSKRAYLYSISIGLFFLNLIYFYGLKDIRVLFIGGGILFLTRLLLILYNNKNLIIKELFYFILYLCAFEIAPLFILFKLIF